jgi:hypothetical protein
VVRRHRLRAEVGHGAEGRRRQAHGLLRGLGDRRFGVLEPCLWISVSVQNFFGQIFIEKVWTQNTTGRDGIFTCVWLAINNFCFSFVGGGAS